jgi:hypothetical protein
MQATRVVRVAASRSTMAGDPLMIAKSAPNLTKVRSPQAAHAAAHSSTAYVVCR